jgi:hypothetical protein
MVTAPPRLRVTASGRASMNRSASPTALPSPAAPDCRSPTGLGATARSNTANISPDSPLRHLAAKVSVRSCEPRVALSLSASASTATRQERAHRSIAKRIRDDDGELEVRHGYIYSTVVRPRGDQTCTEKAGEGSGRIHTSRRDPPHTAHPSLPVTGRRARAKSTKRITTAGNAKWTVGEAHRKGPTESN